MNEPNEVVELPEKRPNIAMSRFGIMKMFSKASSCYQTKRNVVGTCLVDAAIAGDRAFVRSQAASRLWNREQEGAGEYDFVVLNRYLQLMLSSANCRGRVSSLRCIQQYEMLPNWRTALTLIRLS